MDEFGTPTPEGVGEEGAGEFVEPTAETTEVPQNTTEHRELEITPELVKQCEDIAREHIMDIINHDKNIPIRFLFSGLLAKPFNEGFKRNSFFAEDYPGVNVSYAKAYTFNDAMTDSFVEEESFYLTISRLYAYRPEDFSETAEDPAMNDLVSFLQELAPDIAEKILEQVANIEPNDRFTQSRKGRAVEMVLFEARAEEGRAEDDLTGSWRSFNVTKLRESLGEKSPELTKRVIINTITRKPYSEWLFEEKELFYESSVNFSLSKERERWYGYQVYDSAIIIDRDKIDSAMHGILYGTELEIDAKPDAIIGGFPFDTPMDTEPGDYVTEKFKRIYYQHPELSRPLYTSRGEVIWPPTLEQSENDQISEEAQF